MNSFLNGKKALALSALRPPPGTASPHAPVASRTTKREPAAGHAGTGIEVIKDGDKVVRIVVHCACGEKTEVECLYPAGS